MGLYRIVKIS